jgi:hypothetical protein
MPDKDDVVDMSESFGYKSNYFWLFTNEFLGGGELEEPTALGEKEERRAAFRFVVQSGPAPPRPPSTH